MLCSANELRDFEIVAADGTIGSVEEFFLDDERWAVRYIVVNTGNWQSGRQVLISPFSVVQVDRVRKMLKVSLTRSKIEQSPNINTNQPVSRAMEAVHAEYYGYPDYWKSLLLWGVDERPLVTSRPTVRATGTPQSAASAAATAMTDPASLSATAEPPVVSNEVHLLSSRDVGSYLIEATDGAIGRVEDFLLDGDSWAIRYLIADTNHLLPGKKVLISPQWISAIDGSQGKATVSLSRAVVEKTPVYDPAIALSRDYEKALYGHYGQPGYWRTEE